MICEVENLAGPAQSETERLQTALCMLQANIVLYEEMSKRLGAASCQPLLDEMKAIIKGAMTKPK